MEEYFSRSRYCSKAAAPNRLALLWLNTDDKYGQKLVKGQQNAVFEVWTYGLSKGDFRADKIAITPRGTRFDLLTPKGNIPLFLL